MKQEILLIGSDVRQTRLAALMQENGWTVRCHQVAQYPDDFYISSAFDDISAVLLPIPSVTPDGAIHGTETPKIPYTSLLRALPARIPILGGLLPKYANDTHPVCDLAKDPIFAMENAALTAEGAVHFLMEHRPALFGRNILITGYGRIASFLAHRLTGLGAKVFIRARRPEVQSQCVLSGLALDDGTPQQISSYDIVVNTVPAPILFADDVADLRKDCLILDLASAPGGLAHGVIPHQVYLKAPGLPSQYAPDTATEILFHSILRAKAERRLS